MKPDFDKFIYENFFDNYRGYKDTAIEAYEEYRNNLNDDDYMYLGNLFALEYSIKILKEHNERLIK